MLNCGIHLNTHELASKVAESLQKNISEGFAGDVNLTEMDAADVIICDDEELAAQMLSTSPDLKIIYLEWGKCVPEPNGIRESFPGRFRSFRLYTGDGLKFYRHLSRLVKEKPRRNLA